MDDDDFGDFTGFNQDHNSSASSSNITGSSSAAFPNKEGFGSLMSTVVQTSDNNSMTHSTTQATNFPTFDPNFNIPPPLSPPGANIHLAGGVPFDIPPLPDDSSFDNFSPEFEIADPLSLDVSNTHSTGNHNTSVGGSVSHQSIVQPIAGFADFSLSAPGTDVAPTAQLDQENPTPSDVLSGGVSANNTEWTADFGSFSIPPPIDLSETVEDSVKENTSFAASEIKLLPTTGQVSGERESDKGTIEKSKIPVESIAATAGVFTKTGNASSFASFNSTVTPTAASESTSNIDEFTSFEASSTLITSSALDSATTNTTTENVTNFANFEVTPLPANLGSVDNAHLSEKIEDISFGDLSSLQSATHTPSFSAFEDDSSSTHKIDPTTSAVSPSDNFGAFSGAQTSSVAVPSFPAFQSGASSSLQVKEEDASKPALSSNSTNDDFGDFSSSGIANGIGNMAAKNDDFGEFKTVISQTNSAFKNTETKSQSEDDFGDFSTGQGNNFATFSTNSSQKNAAAKDDFGDFSSGISSSGVDDGFGDFTTSSNSNDDFGNFTSSNTGFGAFSSAGTTPTLTTTTKQDVSDVLSSCFTSVGESTGQNVTTSNLHTLLLSSKTQGNTDQSMWESLQQCIDLAIPLYKWDRSSLQNNYYSVLKVDPTVNRLISKPSTLSVLAGHVKFEEPLGGTTAAEDLMESFGFEGGLEEARQRSVSPPPIMSVTKQLSVGRATPTLLDLSLPETPGSPTGHNSFTLTEDLMGLDLNPQPQTQQLTSIQELLRNESLVVNKSNWVDPNLKEFGEGKKKRTSSQSSTPQISRKQNSVELQLQQLGLDANKVSTFTGEKRELSLAARTVLGRLPELSFMLSSDRVVHTQQYSI